MPGLSLIDNTRAAGTASYALCQRIPEVFVPDFDAWHVTFSVLGYGYKRYTEVHQYDPEPSDIRPPNHPVKVTA